MEERYARNIPAISPEEQRLLKEKRVLVAGCGGLGGYLVETLTRLGVGEITVVDGDVFEPSNLNRQLLCTLPSLGQSKVLTAKERAQAVNPEVLLHAAEKYLDVSNAEELTAGQDLVLDALDSAPARLLLEEACTQSGVVLIHGAVQGWLAQVAVVPPGSGVLRRLYGERAGSGEKSTLPFTPPFCAAIQGAQAVELLCGRHSQLESKVLLADLRQLEWDVLSL